MGSYAIVRCKDGIYQYSYTDPKNIELLSKMVVKKYEKIFNPKLFNKEVFKFVNKEPPHFFASLKNFPSLLRKGSRDG